MASSEGDLERRRQTENRLMASFIELLAADAIVVVYSWTEKRKTKAKAISFGNTFATKGLIEWTYEEVFDAEPETPETDEEEEEEEDD